MNYFINFVKNNLMKKNIYLLILIIASLLYSCKKKSGCNDSTAINFGTNADLNDGSCIYGPKVKTGNGDIVFYKSPLGGIDTVNVQIGGILKQIKVSYSFLPSCGQSGCANYSLSPGTYAFTADEIHGTMRHWSGNVTITSQTCTTHWIY